MDVFWTLPPVTRTITAAAVVVSALGYANIIDLMRFVFISQAVFTVKMVPQAWRLITGFFITKKGMAIALDPYFCTWSPALHPPALTARSLPVQQRS
jgi:Derlin-2/3